MFPGLAPPENQPLVQSQEMLQGVWNTRLDARICSQPPELPHTPLPSHVAPPAGQALLGSIWRVEIVSARVSMGGAPTPGEQGPPSATTRGSKVLLKVLVQPAHQPLQGRPSQGLAVTKAMAGLTPEPCVQAQMVSLEFY